MPNVIQPVRVEVDYQLREYLRLVEDFVLSNKAIKQPPSKNILSSLSDSTLMLKLTLYVLCPPMFVYKKFMVGRCVFEFDSEEWRRTSKGYTASRAWQKVAKVRTLTQAYMIELKEGGGMPVPYRVFRTGQRQAFEALLPAGLLQI